MVPPLAFVLLELADLLRQLDPCSAIEAAGMTGQHMNTIKHADLLQIGPYTERAPHMRAPARYVIA